MIRNIVPASPRKRVTAAVATGALIALGGALLSASAANATTQTPAPGVNYSVVNPSNPVNRAGVVAAPNNQYSLTDAHGKSVEVPAWVIAADANHDKVWAVADPNNTTNDVTPFGMFFYIPSTHDLVNVGSGGTGGDSDLAGDAIAASSTSYVGQQDAYNASAATAELESLAPGTEYDVIIAQTPFNTDGTEGDTTVLTANEKYYSVAYQYNGKNLTSGVYESGVVGSTPNAAAPAATTATALTATADANGGVVLTATIQDPNNANATDTTATGGVTFTAASGLSPVTAQVSNGVATATISYPTTNYATTYSFTAAYSGNASFAASTSGAQSATTSAAPANFGQIGSNEIVTIPAPAAGTLTLSVATGGVQFGTAVADLVHGTYSATAPLPESTVTDTRYAKGDWTLNGVSTALVSGSNTIPASDLSWSTPVINTATGSGAVAGSAATSLATAQALATFHNGALLGQIVTKADTTLSLTTPINQATGTYAGTLTITLL